MAIEDMPPSSQSSFPSRSYERPLLTPQVMISVRFSFSQTNGVDQLLFSSRSTVQISLPVFLSSAVRNECFSLSLRNKHRAPGSEGAAAVPQPSFVGKASHFFVQSRLPLRS